MKSQTGLLNKKFDNWNRDVDLNFKYYINDFLKVRFLACLELFDQHTGMNISKHIKETLLEFKIITGIQKRGPIEP